MPGSVDDGAEVQCNSELARFEREEGPSCPPWWIAGRAAAASDLAARPRRALVRCCALREPRPGSTRLQVPLSRSRVRDVERADFDPFELAELERIARAGAPRALAARARELEWIARSDRAAAEGAVAAYADAALPDRLLRGRDAAGAARALRRAVDIASSVPAPGSAVAELLRRVEDRIAHVDGDGALFVLASIDALERLGHGEAEALAELALAHAERAVAAGSESVALELFDRARRWLARSEHAGEADVVPVLRSTVVAELARRRRAQGASPRYVAALLALASDELSPVASSDLATRIRNDLATAVSDVHAPTSLGADALVAAGRSAMRAELRIEEAPLVERWCELGALEPQAPESGSSPVERDLARFGDGALESARFALARDRELLGERFEGLATACVRLDAAVRAEWRGALGAWLSGDFAFALAAATVLIERDVTGERGSLAVAADGAATHAATWLTRRSASAARNGGADVHTAANVAAWVLVAALAQREVEDGPLGAR